MAPITSMASLPQKRPLSQADSDLHPAKKLRQSYHRHHSLHSRPQEIPPSEPAILKRSSLDKLLVDGIKTLCEEQGARQGIQDPVIESLALEAFTNAAEEFVLKVCATVRRSMLSARRTTPQATDFETTIRALDLPWPFDQLQRYTTTPPINPSLLPTPPPDDPFHNVHQLPTSFLGPGLDGGEDKEKERYIPSHFPAFPSKHTYKDTPVFPTREVDPRRIRELATEEGKLGEEALRKLAGAMKAETTISAEKAPRKDDAPRPRTRRKEEYISMQDMFEATMRELLKEQPASSQQKFELAPIINCERQYRLQDTAIARRTEPVAVAEGGRARIRGGGDGDLLSAKASGKQRAEELYLPKRG